MLKFISQALLASQLSEAINAGIETEEALTQAKERVDQIHKKYGIKGEEKAKKKNKADPESKMSKATEIFKDWYGEETPKNIQLMFINQLEMTDKGARTYYYNIKKKLGV